VTPGEPTEQLPRAQTSASATSGPRLPLRPEDVKVAREQAKKSPAPAPARSAVTTASEKGAVAPRSAGSPAATKPAARPAPAAAGRRVRLTLARIDPFSALKMSFLLSVALGIAMVVAVAALWLVLKGMGAFDQVNNLVGSIIQDGDKKFDIMDFVGFGRVVSLSIVFAVIDVFIITAIATLGSFIYNVSASLVGGLGLTLTDD
jgi:hypothetical protein